MDIDKIKSETIQEMQSKFEDDGIGNFLQQIVLVSAETTALMLQKYNKEINRDE